MKGKRKSVHFGEDMPDLEPPNEGLKLVSKFAGEAFGTDNVRTVFASASQDNVEREDRVILLIGPAGTGKSTLIDCMCNYFYGADLKSDTRYKIADEIFDQTTPIKTIIKYVFNETRMPYRPIVIDTPGIGSESGVQTDAEISEMLSSFLLQSHRVIIHAIGFVLKYSDARVSLKREAQIRETLSMFPKWMTPNIVPLLSSSDGTGTIPAPIRALLEHLGLSKNRVFFFNSGSLFDVSEAEAITEQLRTMYWAMTMEGLEGFFEHVGQMNPQCIAEELPAPPASKSPSLTFEKHFSNGLHTPNYTPPPPPITDTAENISKDISFHKTWGTAMSQKSTTNSTEHVSTAATRSLSDDTGAPYSKIRKTNYEMNAEERRERIIPIKLLHTPSKTSLEVEHSQVSENRRSFFESSSQLQSTKHDGMELNVEDGSVIKRYTYDPSSMSHKEFILKGSSKKEITTGDGIDLMKDTPTTPATIGGVSVTGASLSRPQRVNETVINDVPIENLVGSRGYTHIKSSPPPEYTPEPITQRTPLATLAGADQQSPRDTQQRTSTSIDIDANASSTQFSRSSAHRKVERHSSSRDAAGINPLGEPSPAVSARSDWTYHTGDDVNIRSFDSTMQRIDQTGGQLSPSKQNNDFIITPEMKRSRSPIVVRVTMGRKDKNITRIDGDEQTADTAVGPKKPIETNIDDVAPPDYDNAWMGVNRTSQSSLYDRQNLASSHNTDVMTGYATSFGYSGSATAIATKSAPGTDVSPQQGSPQEAHTDQRAQNLMSANGKSWSYGYGDEQTTTAALATLTTTGGSALQQNQKAYRMNGVNEATNKRRSAGGYGDDETTTTTTKTVTTHGGAPIGGYQQNQNTYGSQSISAKRASGGYGYGDDETTTTTTKMTTTTGDTAIGAYQQNQIMYRGQSAAAQRGKAYGYDDEETTAIAKTTVTTGGVNGATSQQREGMPASSAIKRASRGFGYDDDETTTTTKTILTTGTDAIGAQQKQPASAYLVRKGSGYGYGDDEYVTTTKTVLTSEEGGGMQRVPLHQTQNAYSGQRSAAGYGYEDEETTTTKTTTNVRYDMPPGNIDSVGGEHQKDELENYLQYNRNEQEDLLGRHSSFHTHQHGVPPKNYLEKEAQLTSPLMRSIISPSSQLKKKRFNCFDFIFFILAPCFILLILIVILITLGVA